MKIEDRSKIMDSGTQIICVCESEAECEVIDLLGKPGDKIKGEIRLSDGYGECYLRLEPAEQIEVGKDEV